MEIFTSCGGEKPRINKKVTLHITLNALLIIIKTPLILADKISKIDKNFEISIPASNLTFKDASSRLSILENKRRTVCVRTNS